MPFVKAKVSCPVTPVQESELKAGMGKAIENRALSQNTDRKELSTVPVKEVNP